MEILTGVLAGHDVVEFQLVQDIVTVKLTGALCEL